MSSTSFPSSEQLFFKLKDLTSPASSTLPPLSPFSESPASSSAPTPALTPTAGPSTTGSPAAPSSPELSASVTLVPIHETIKPSLHTARDPHQPPDFTKTSFVNPSSPILYLPPLISSLPDTYPAQPAPFNPRGQPLKTASRLPSIDEASLAFHHVLHNFHPADIDYALKPYAEAFNWDELELPEDVEREWYAVAFRSIRKEGSDSAPLYSADQKAHEEAVQNGGLLMYWYGTPRADTGLNLASCIWQSRADAIAANSRPHHIQAMRLAASSYEQYDFERYTIRKVKGERTVQIEPWVGETGRR